jgi:hypothetical protein
LTQQREPAPGMFLQFERSLAVKLSSCFYLLSTQIPKENNRDAQLRELDSNRQNRDSSHIQNDLKKWKGTRHIQDGDL